MQSGRPVYDFWMNDSDFIGTHPRYGDIVGGSLTDFMANEGKGRHQPDARPARLHGPVVRHLHRRQAVPAPRPAVRQPLLVPPGLVPAPRPEGRSSRSQVRLRPRRAGELVGVRGHRRLLHQRRSRTIDGQRVYGHMDYGKKDPSLGWRFTDAWLSMAGAGDKRPAQRQAPSTSGASASTDGIPRGSSISARRRCQRPRRRVYALTQVRRVAEEVRAARGRRHGLPRVRPGPRPGPHRPADLLVQRLHRRLSKPEACR